MNILIPHKWLLSHLNTEAKPQEIQRLLSLSGPSVEQIKEIKGEPVYDIELTTNRVDSMSVRGIAREAAAILPESGVQASLKKLEIPDITSDKPLDIKIENDSRLCRRILAVKLDKVKVEPSDSLIKKRLQQVGQRPLNNIIDITNFVMWEIGHPIHVFDYDRLSQKTIIVREAKKGEKLTTLDSKSHSLRGGEVIFDDGRGKIIDLPGIMGTKNTVVTPDTKSVLLWVESIDPDKIRKASMQLSIRSQAAVLNEKNVDPELGATAIKRAVSLYKSKAQASAVSQLLDIYPKKPTATTITLDHERLTTYTDVEIDPKKVARILTNIGCFVESKKLRKKQIYNIKPPTWRRHDITIPEDIIEEISRIYGYHNLPSKLMAGKLPLKPQSMPFNLEDKIKNDLSAWGATEVYTYSLVNSDLAKASGRKLSDHLHISNPLSEDQVLLRRSILPSHLQVIKDNQNRFPVKIFELANTYIPQKGVKLPEEKLELIISAAVSYPEAKELAEMLLTRNKVHYQFLSKNGYSKLLNPQRTAAIAAPDDILGIIGEVDPKSLESFELDPPISAAIFDARKLLDACRIYPKFTPLPSYPPIIEDLTFEIPKKTYIGEVLDEIESASKLVEKVKLKDTYRQNFSFRIEYRHPERSLTDQDVSPARKKIIAKLAENFKADLVGDID